MTHHDNGDLRAVDLAADPLADTFNRLGPDEILDAVEVEGRRCTGRFLQLNSYENRVYQLDIEDGVTVVGKFYRPGRWSRDAIADEHRFLFELAEEEIPVSTPIELAPGETIGEIEGIFYALFEKIGGRIPQELDDIQVGVLGRLVARLHNVGARAPAPHRMRLTPETYGLDNLAYLLERDVIPYEARDVYGATVEMLVARIEPMFNGVPTHRLHGDCHLGNLLWRPQGATFVDFDDMLVGPAVQDLWMQVASYDADGQRQRELLIKAYAEMRDFDPTWLRLVEPLRALRFVHYSTWIARRWHDPIFPRTFPHFGTLQYWQREIQDLREQIARIDHEVPY